MDFDTESLRVYSAEGAQAVNHAEKKKLPCQGLVSKMIGFLDGAAKWMKKECFQQGIR